MSSFSGSMQPDPSMIGGVNAPPFARVPVPEDLFQTRARRFEALAAHHDLAPYLHLMGALAAAQAAILPGLPAPDGPDQEAVERALTHHMPPLDRARFTADAAFEATFERLLGAAGAIPMPPAAAAALARVQAAAPEERDAMVRNVLADSLPVEALAEHVFVAAALQVHFARLAATLDPKRLTAVAEEAACPACGGPPASTMVVGWHEAHGARYCACALCGTLWNYVRVRCTACGSTAGLGLQEVEGGSGTIKAETCDSCHSYVKVLYQSKDADLDPIADDVASLGLDLLMKDGPYRRAGFNPFLLGY